MVIGYVSLLTFILELLLHILRGNNRGNPSVLKICTLQLHFVPNLSHRITKKSPKIEQKSYNCIKLLGRDQRDREAYRVPRDSRHGHPMHETSSGDESFVDGEEFHRVRCGERVPRPEKKWNQGIKVEVADIEGCFQPNKFLD